MNVLKLLKWLSYILLSLKKNRIFLIVLLERTKRKIIGFDISYDKNPETIQKIMILHQKQNNIILMDLKVIFH